MMTAANTLQIFKSYRENLSSLARRQDFCKCIRDINSLRVIGKRIEAEKSAASRSSRVSEGRASRQRAWILKNAGRSGVVEAALIDRRHGKALLPRSVDELSFD